MTKEQIRREAQKQGMNSVAVTMMIETERKKAMRYAVRSYSVVVASVLRDKLDFGQMRLERLLGNITNLFDSVEKGYVSIEELEKTLHDETGIKIV